MMEITNHSPKFLRQRRFLLVLPLLVLPFASLLFWSLGGGQGSLPLAEARGSGGLSQALPEAQLAAGLAAGKLGYYKQAASDSARLRELLKKDAYAFGQSAAGTHAGQDAPMAGADIPLSWMAPGSSSGSEEAQLGSRQASVYRKLGQLQEALREEPQAGALPKAAALAALPAGTAPPTGRADLARLEQLMHQRQESKGDDPELQQLNGMLEKILDIQHPQLVREKIRQASEDRRGAVFPVAPNIKTVPVSLLESREGAPEGAPFADTGSGFHTIEEITPMSTAQGMIPAVVHETQTVVAGATIKLRLTEEVFINGMLLPKDSFVFGTASLQGERLKITIQGVRFRQSLFPVALAVYDLDGLEGIHIPGGITREVARQAADRAARDIGLSSLNPSLEVQAMHTGLEAARSLLGRKTRQVKATVKAGYQVLLRDEQQS